MKIKVIPTLIIAGISALAGYLFYAANAQDGNAGCWIMMVCSALTLFVPLAGGFGIQHETSGSSVGIAVLSVLTAMIHLVINLVATFAPFHAPLYISFSGIVLLLYIGIVYSMSKAL